MRDGRAVCAPGQPAVQVRDVGAVEPPVTDVAAVPSGVPARAASARAAVDEDRRLSLPPGNTGRCP
ncbi:hypothetical protein GCM10009536_25810 [Streptomyces thermocarboxydus]|uniref:Uncharacterized protein n=1 Tax=Streptomyces thermodiastaticus TaxID=44061 RepID=A0ABU0KDI2_9ACTN|nr:hypothetical protein [Streptomyces thermodiastaticus]